MKRLLLFVAAPLLLAGAIRATTSFRIKHPVSGREITVPGREGANALLVSGWKTTPAGRHLRTGDMILSGQLSPDGKLFAFTNTGFTAHALHIVDVATEKEVATFPLQKAWSGLVFAPNGKRIYVSSGPANPGPDIQYYDRWDKGGWKSASINPVFIGYSLRGARKDSTNVSWLGTSRDGALLYALNNSDGRLYILETESGRAVGRLYVGDSPLAGQFSKDGKTLYVANLGSANVAIVDVSDPVKPSIAGTLNTDPHPNALAITADGRLFVSCGHTNNVIAFDLKSRERLEVINTALGPNAPPGSTPLSVALSPAGDRLYVANADNNSVSVIDVKDRRQSRPLGFLPTGWYPTLVSTTADGKRIIIASGKGTGTGPNGVKRPIGTIDPGGSYEYIGYLMNGLVSFVDTPDAARLSAYTKQVYQNSPYRDALLQRAGSTGAASVIPMEVGQPSPIKHVLFIMKENRTYDQVFGDIKQGNGDSTLTLFGREVTPNQHAVAEQYVLLDNLYASGEVSMDGQPWTTSAYANEITERGWAMAYSGHGSVKWNTKKESPWGEGVGVQSTPYIWELARQHGLSVKVFGMGDRRGVAEVQSKRYDPRPDDPRAFGPGDTTRAGNFVKEFQEMDQAGTVPNFMFMGLGGDHTQGTEPGALTPKAYVAENDLAVGWIVEAITKSKAWPEFAIFIIEDDAQAGPDHVDSHRTTGLVISPYVKRRFVDSDMYSTMSMLRTVELLLGLPPMTQHDAAAAPMVNSFTTKPDLSSYTAISPRINLRDRNPTNAYGAAESAKMDFSEYDRIDDDALNRILWHSIKGANVPYPAPVRRVIPTPRGLFGFATTKAEKEDR